MERFVGGFFSHLFIASLYNNYVVNMSFLWAEVYNFMLCVRLLAKPKVYGISKIKTLYKQKH